MPKEHKKRGRREEKKRKREEEKIEALSKKPKTEDLDDYIQIDDEESGHYDGQIPYFGPGELQFYGLLDEGEQEYFKRADSMLEVNQFGDQEERDLFLANVYKEADGKELKIANSQSCSRLMERLILLSTPSQLKNLFQKFSGHFLNLVQHRFASHCCEALFLQAAPLVTSEITAPLDDKKTSENCEVYVSMENLFLYTCNELESNLGYLMTDQFASHALRVLLIVLSGKPLAAAIPMRSKKKERITINGNKTISTEADIETRSVPAAFRTAIVKIMVGTVAGLDTTNLRALSTHPIANPVLQLLLELELTISGKQSARDADSLLRKLLPDDPLAEGTDSAALVTHLTYDPIGSRLLEVIVTHAPGKTFKALYKCSFSEKIGNLAKNETASFVVTKVIERLNKDDLQTAVEHICPQLEILVKRSRTSVVKALIERCRIRGVDTQPIADGLEQAYNPDASQRLVEMLHLDEAAADVMAEDRRKQLEAQDSSKIHSSLLAQCMLEAPDSLRELIIDGLLVIDTPRLLSIAKDRTGSRVLQTALTCSEQSMKFCRTFIPRFIGNIENLASDVVASHVIDSIWEATVSLRFVRERIAEEIAQCESSLRASVPGRAVWRNWKMDLYQKRRKEWLNDAKGQDPVAKSGIELAREKFVTKKTASQHKTQKKRPQRSTGANSIPPQPHAPNTIQGKA
ncbi:Nucleolar protein 9 [Lecanora helva]